MYGVSLDSLNEAKKKINYLLQMKYNDETMEYVETDDQDADTTFQKVISGVEKASELVFQLITFVAREKKVEKTSRKEPMIDENTGLPLVDSRGRPKMKTVEEEHVSVGRPYYRNTSTYLNFHQNLVKLLNTLKPINLTLQNLTPNFGYIEPENMSLYKDHMAELRVAYEQYNTLVQNNGYLKISKTGIGSSNTPEEDNLILFNSNVANEMAKLYQHDQIINSTYNYRNANVVMKRSTPFQREEPQEQTVVDYEDF